MSKSDWETRALVHVSKLRPRISALGEQFYMGCGFHYSLEDEISYLENAIPKKHSALVTADAMAANIALEVRLEHLTRRVVKAEMSAAAIAKARGGSDVD